ncbi:hypothetical protein [Kiloniella sp.]|uniref:hypothetical protein n=1 Tax=Kiloniella sp. TaxID=1938587 RepID=UPI003B014523
MLIKFDIQPFKVKLLFLTHKIFFGGFLSGVLTGGLVVSSVLIVSLTSSQSFAQSQSQLQSQSLALADEPVAIVDDIVGDVQEVEIMDLLWEGQSLSLNSGSQISIGYMNACLSEKITGGKVTIGIDKSTVVGGLVETEQLDCGQKIQGKSASSKTVALTAVFRNPNAPKTPEPDHTLYSLYPAIVVAEGQTVEGELVRVARLDKNNVDPVEFALENGRVDFHRHNIRLSSGGVYRISVGQKETVVKISPRAKARNISLVQRLVKF